ncbi:MAG: response regulator [bacterium]
MKIVLVDDDPLVLVTLSGLFKRKGHTVLTYNSPLECPIYKSPHGSCYPAGMCPDIIISDIDMPHVNGLEFIESLFTKGCKCKHVAMLSGIGIADADMKRMAEYGVRYFSKPLDYVEFEMWLMLRARN